MDKPQINSDLILLEAMRDYPVPLQHSVALLFKVKNISVSDVAKAGGATRNCLYKALSENRRPNWRLYRSVVDHLGVDPWAVYEEATGDERTDDTAEPVAVQG